MPRRQQPSSTLSDADKRRVAPYVTDAEGPVFALTNLPEVVKGALFSRYSRSALGLRELMLKEFLEELPEGERAQGISAGVAVARAQDFYDRILDGYGDDSIGELGGAHLAIEDVSMIGTKILEDPRIGGSPLEKSTRYVSFADKVNGDFRFYKEPRLLRSAHKQRYLGTCRMLFETYARLMEPVTESIARDFPREPGTSDAAYRRAVRARAFDALRGLLPASTLTNMGIFGNGRFFESLLIRLRLSGLKEAESLAQAMHRELDKLIPSFIRRASPRHPHYKSFAAFHKAQREAIRRLSAESAGNGAGKEFVSGQAVRLIQALPEDEEEAERQVIAALMFADSGWDTLPIRFFSNTLPPEERLTFLTELAEARGNRRHKLPRALETVHYTFDLVGDFGMYRDLHRHRMMTQERQPLSTELGYEVPEEIEAAGVRPDFDAAMQQAQEAFEAIAPEFPAEAQYAVPMAYRIRWYTHLSLRELMWLVELRSSPQGHPAYRRMAQDMFLAVREVHPRLAGLIRFVDLKDYSLGRESAEQRQEAKTRANSARQQLLLPWD